MRRIDNWPAALDALLAQHRRTPFAWGAHDCCQFARRDVLALTARDPAADCGLREYATAEEAAALLAELGGIEALPARAGLAEIAPALAQRGDLALTDFDARPTLGVVAGRHAAFVGKTGLIFVPTLNCRKAWRVG